jgi:hypothetical protein
VFEASLRRVVGCFFVSLLEALESFLAELFGKRDLLSNCGSCKREADFRGPGPAEKRLNTSMNKRVRIRRRFGIDFLMIAEKRHCVACLRCIC